MFNFFRRERKSETVGIIYALLAAALWGLYPVIVKQGVKDIPPLWFATLSTIFSILSCGTFFILTKKWKELKIGKAYFPLWMVAFCNTIFAYLLFFPGAKMTSGVNSSVLLLAEIPITLAFTHFIGEKTTGQKLLGGFGILVGAVFILFQGKFVINLGDLLIIGSTILYPLGNFYSKKVLHLVSPITLVMVRFLLALPPLWLLASIFEPHVDIVNILQNHWLIIVINGVVILFLEKILWYECLKRLDISKAVGLLMSFPLFSLLAFVGFYNEKIAPFQWIGLVLMGIGIFFTIRRLSVDSRLTRYTPDDPMGMV